MAVSRYGQGFHRMGHLQEGITGSVEFIVDDEHTAKEIGSGSLEVLATPVMISMLEKAAWTTVQPYLAENCTTVGSQINVSHESPTPIGMKVECIAKLVAIDERKLIFEVDAYDEKGHIGGGTHERYIVYTDRFQAKALSKISK
ncbi:MAG: thioesterase family protein [Fibrobacter sp.]|nr:thioesterase family protein [Fibrobacter sp.]